MRAIAPEACAVSLERCMLLHTERAQLYLCASQYIRCVCTLSIVFVLVSNAKMHLAGISISR